VDGELLLKGNRAVARATSHQAELRAAVFALDSIPEGQDVRFRWTKGHDGTEGNEHAHRLATQARRVAEGLEWPDVVPPEEPPTLP
jgi:ribonuclease HI